MLIRQVIDWHSHSATIPYIFDTYAFGLWKITRRLKGSCGEYELYSPHNMRIISQRITAIYAGISGRLEIKWYLYSEIHDKYVYSSKTGLDCF